MYLIVENNLIKENIFSKLQSFFTLLPKVDIRSVIEIIILAVFIYIILNWIYTSRAWVLVRGIFVILFVVFIAYCCNFTVILWILKQGAALALVALLIIFQNELRFALEQLGKQKFFAKLFPKSHALSKMSEKTIREICKASFAMGKVKTGALIVIQQSEKLEEVEESGIDIDGVVSNQLLINIFEKNTPLHDGAVLIYGDKVKAATCYLPLTKKFVPKEYGTRHRAALGMSENSDAIIVVVSEETGNVSVCMDGKIQKVSTEEELFETMSTVNSTELMEEKVTLFRKMEGHINNGEV